MRFYISQSAGLRVCVTEHRDIAITVTVGNDIEGTDFFGRDVVYKTLITESEIDGNRKHACHVIVPFPLFKSRITKRRVREAIESWEEAIDDLLDNK